MKLGMKQARRNLCVAAAAAVLLAPAGHAQQAKEPIRIGSTLALTGPLSATAMTHKLVGEIYLEQLNARGHSRGWSCSMKCCRA